MHRIMHTQCVDVSKYHVCGNELYDLFNGDEVVMKDGHHLVADFATEHYDPHSNLCRKVGKDEYCLDHILDMY